MPLLHYWRKRRGEARNDRRASNSYLGNSKVLGSISVHSDDEGSFQRF